MVRIEPTKEFLKEKNLCARCGKKFKKSDNILQCPYCDKLFHQTELFDRVNVISKCPECRRPLKIQENDVLNTKNLACSICNEKILTADDVSECPCCNFDFHSDHFLNWIKEKKICPNCTRPLSLTSSARPQREKCAQCRGDFEAETELEYIKCSYCESFMHTHHLDESSEVLNFCASCKKPFKLINGEIIIEKGINCEICNQPLQFADKTIICQNCNAEGHADHILDYLDKNPGCPKCNSKISLDLYALNKLEDIVGMCLPLMDEFINKGTEGVIMDGHKVIGLIVPHQKFAQIPRFFGFFKNLRFLRMYWSKLSTIPDYISEMESLEEIYLPRNEFTTFPESLTKLKNLKVVNIENNKISIINDSITKFEKLETLVLSANKISEPPQSLFRIKSLKLLDLSGNPLGKLPDNIYELENLKDLQILNCGLIELPSTFPNIKNLFNLNARYNRITKLPDNFGNLKELAAILMDGNQLTELPEDFGGLTNLNTIYMSKNKLANLPPSFKDLRRLQFLDLSQNQFKTIPTHIWSLKALGTINFRDNPLVEEDVDILEKTADIILEQLRKRAPINILLINATNDLQNYKILDLLRFLKDQNEILEVSLFGEDSLSEDEQWFEEVAQKYQLALFFGTKNSIYQSTDCLKILRLVEKHYIPVIPIKTPEIGWGDLTKAKVARNLGKEYDESNFNEFCDDLYQYILSYKHNVNLMERGELRLQHLSKYNNFSEQISIFESKIFGELDNIQEQVQKKQEELK